MVVSDAPAFAAATMLDELDSGAAELLRGIPYATRSSTTSTVSAT